MKLYPKTLRNIKDLQQEKKKLLRQSRALEEEELFSFGNLTGKGDKEGASILDFLPVSNPMVSMGIKLAQKWLAHRGNKKQRKEEAEEQPRKDTKSKNLLKTAAIEIIGGYLKWKAVELSVKGIKHIIKKRRENKENSDV